jgi:transposase
MRQSRTLEVGMEVHQESIAVASVAPEHHAAVVSLGPIGTRQSDLAHRLRRGPSTGPPRVCVYDAGSGGSGRCRDRPPTGHLCAGVAPAVIPQTPGDRVTTPRRAASTRARRRRSGALPPVSGPTGDEAALRAQGRARAAALRARQAAQVRLNACLVRHDIRAGGRAGGCPPPAPPSGFPADGRAVQAQAARLQRLAPARPEPGKPWRLHPGIAARHGLRGLQSPGAVTLGAALGDRPRVDHPSQLRRDLGLSPAASSRGDRRRPAGRPHAGHPHARRALRDGAWAARAPAQRSRPLQVRRDTRPNPRPARRGQAPGRVGPRARQLRARGQPATQVVVASAREGLAFLWAIARAVPVAASRPPPSRLRPRGHRGPEARGPALVHRPSDETPPRGGVTLDGVKRRPQTLGPRARPAPAGGLEGGRHPPAIRRIDRRLCRAPAVPRTNAHRTDNR